MGPCGQAQLVGLALYTKQLVNEIPTQQKMEKLVLMNCTFVDKQHGEEPILSFLHLIQNVRSRAYGVSREPVSVTSELVIWSDHLSIATTTSAVKRWGPPLEDILSELEGAQTIPKNVVIRCTDDIAPELFQERYNDLTQILSQNTEERGTD